jgi:hypothetical protein
MAAFRRNLRLLLLVCGAVLFTSVSYTSADVRISGVGDFSFGVWGGVADLVSSDPVCIYNSASAAYTITASGSGPGGNLSLASGGNSLGYDVAFRGSVGGYVTLTANSPQSFSAANQISNSCGGGTNADVRVTVSASNLLAATAGSYSGTLTVTVGPE